MPNYFSEWKYILSYLGTFSSCQELFFKTSENLLKTQGFVLFLRHGEYECDFDHHGRLGTGKR